MTEAEDLNALKHALAARGGLTVAEWSRHDYLYKKLDPAGFAQRKREADKRVVMDMARRDLSLDDLRVLVAEKEAAA